MADDPRPLSDDDVHALLVAAVYALGRADGATVRGDTALKAARRALALLQLSLVMAMEAGADQLPGVLPEPSIRD